MKHALLSLLLVALVSTLALGAAGTPPPAKAPKKVTLDVVDKPVAEVLKQVASSTGETILVEKLVSGNVTAKVKDLTAEQAIDAVCKSGKLMWRKIYVLQGSVLTKDADALAAQMRTVLALRFPDIVIAPEGRGGSFVHVQKASAANEFCKVVPPAAGLTPVYLVTDDVKAAQKEIKDAGKQKVKKYVETQKEMLKSFLDMTPEERQAAMREGMTLVNQMGPEGVQQMMNSMLEMDPQAISDISRVQMNALMSMTPEARKALLRMQIQSQQDMFKNLPPDQMQQLQKEIQDIAQEMQQGSGSPQR